MYTFLLGIPDTALAFNKRFRSALVSVYLTSVITALCVVSLVQKGKNHSIVSSNPKRKVTQQRGREISTSHLVSTTSLVSTSRIYSRLPARPVTIGRRARSPSPPSTAAVAAAETAVPAVAVCAAAAAATDAAAAAAADGVSEYGDFLARPSSRKLARALVTIRWLTARPSRRSRGTRSPGTTCRPARP